MVTSKIFFRIKTIYKAPKTKNPLPSQEAGFAISIIS